MHHHAIVVGGSFAGISAALPLARARREILVVDAGQRRNRFVKASHGFLGQDGRAPDHIIAEARQQLLAYPNVSFVEATATEASGHAGNFSIKLSSGETHSADRIILATGIKDILPEVPGLAERWGKSVFHCPYCHGYELNNGPVAVLAVSPLSMHHALMLPDWGKTSFLLNDRFSPNDAERNELARRGTETIDAKVVRLVGGADGGVIVEFENAPAREFNGLFVATQVEPASPLAAQLGCELEHGPMGVTIRTDAMKATSVPGVFACGDTARAAGNVPFAVGDGALAGTMAHRSMMFGLEPH